jgi:Glycosyl hydrolases family 39
MHSTSPQRRTAALRISNPGEPKPPTRRSRLIGAALIVGTIAIGIALVATGSVPLGSKTATAPPSPSDVTVDFGVPTATDDSAAIGVDESTYGTPSDINDPKAQALLKKLGVGYARIALTLANPADPGSRVTCAANGCDTGINPVAWVRMMESVGETPVAQIPETISPADAAAIVTHLNGAGGAGRPVLYWIIGNEPNANGESAGTYDPRFNTLFDAMKKADPRIEIGGPASYGFDRSFLQQFLQDCGSRVDFVDFHFYQAPGHQTAAQLRAEPSAMSQDLATLRTMIKTTVPDRASAIAIHVGEWNFSADPATLATYAFTGFASALDADLLGRILAAGADGLAWGSKNATLSLLYGAVYPGDATAPAGYKPDTPMPLYQATAMFTGQGLFPRFGTTIVSATSIRPGVDVFASARPDEIVIVNTNASSERVTVRVDGSSLRAAVVWQLHQTTPVAKPPVKKGTATSQAGIFSIELPGDSVTTMVMTTLTSKQK